MENMYTGKSSRNPNTPMIWGILIGLAAIAFGIYMYFDLAAWEQSDEQKYMNSMLWGLYDLGGKLLVALFFSIVGAGFIGMGIYNRNKLVKLKNDAKG